MSRSDRRRPPSYNYDYLHGPRTTRDRTPPFLSDANSDDDDDGTARYLPRPAASLVTFDNLEFRPRTRDHHHPHHSHQPHREHIRDRDPSTRDRRRHRVQAAPSLKPSLSTGFIPPSSPGYVNKDSLKHRLSLHPSSSTTAGSTVSGYTISGSGPPRTRSLSLSRLSSCTTTGGGAGGRYASYSCYSSSPDNHYFAGEDDGVEGRGSEDDDDGLLLERHRDEWGVLPAVPGAPPPLPTAVTPFGLGAAAAAVDGSPRAGWCSRPGSREREGMGPGYERGRYRVVGGGNVVEGRRVSPASGVGLGEESLRVRFGGGERVNGRVLVPGQAQAQVRRRRSESYEKGGKVRKGVSPAAVGRAASKYRGVKPQYNQVHALILTWSFHDLRTENYTAPAAADYVSLEEETARLRHTLQGYGYTVHEFLIPMHRSAESLKSKLKQFCRYAADDTLLLIYYHGHGAMDEHNELVFSSHDHPESPEWSKAAAAELYAALLSGDVCSSHGRRDKYQDLLKKYERYRPVSSIPWASLRTPILSAPCDVLLVLDCCAAGGAGLGHLNWQPPAGAAAYTKHLFAACGFESSTSDDMTAAMCEVLDEWVPSATASSGGGRSRSNSADAATAAAAAAAAGGKKSGGVSVGGGAAGPVGGGQFLTTKRLHQLMEDKLQKRSVGSQPIFKQLLPQDPEQYITLPNLRRRERERDGGREREGEKRGRRGYILA